MKERVESFEAKELTLGKDLNADLHLLHSSVPEAMRARIRRQEGELVLINYDSAAPMYVNGQGVNKQAIVHGDVIRVGDSEIVVVSEARLDPREQMLVDDITNAPSDEDLRSVYADWLEENGLSDRAEYLRLESKIERALKGTWGPSIRDDVALLSGLARNLPPAWLALVRRRPRSLFPKTDDEKTRGKKTKS